MVSARPTLIRVTGAPNGPAAGLREIDGNPAARKSTATPAVRDGGLHLAPGHSAAEGVEPKDIERWLGRVFALVQGRRAV